MAKRFTSATWSSSTTPNAEAAAAEPGLVGILGGTFDPVHLGHIVAAEEVRQAAGIKAVWLMPNAEPPHRSQAEAPAGDRLAMVRLAVEGITGLYACDLEVERGGRSYTIDSLRILQRRHPGRSFALLLGADQAANIQRWHEPAAVIAAVEVIVFNRRQDQLSVPRAFELGFDPQRTRVVRVETPPIAAHEIRRRVAEGLTIDGLVPAAVARYIEAHQLYRTKSRMG